MKLQFININDMRLLEYVKDKARAENAPVFNFYSMLDFGYRLEGLKPLPNIMQNLSYANSFRDDNYTVQFDKAYAYQLLYNEPSFIDLMRVLSMVENTETVIVVTNHSHPVVEAIVDSLIKFIQERYSLQSFLINDIDDIDPFATSTFITEGGYLNYIDDVKRMGRYYDPHQLLQESEFYI